jgi:histidine ammonia-lyase
MKLSITGETLTYGDLAKAAHRKATPELSPDALTRIKASRDLVDAILAENRPAYGITTGVGSQKDYKVDPAGAARYNAKLVKAHATRVPGPKLSEAEVRGALVFLANQCARGFSGVTPELARLVTAAAARDDLPEVDAQGSVGSSDLVPNSQIACWLLDLPEARSHHLPRPKETLSLINNNAISLSVGALALASCERLLDVFDLAGAATLEGFRGCLPSISQAANNAHMRAGQADTAARLRKLLEGSALWQKGASRFLQDPLSIRFISQTHGAVREAFVHTANIWNSELNSTHDNPILDVAQGECVSVGNMDTTRMTLALDYLRLSLARMADMSGDRIHKIQWPAFSGLPAGFAQDSAVGGVQFLNMGHIAASLITQVKMDASPVALHSVGQVADGVEDTAAHAMHASLRLKSQLDAAWIVATIELMTAIWALARRAIPPAQMGRGVARAYDKIAPLLPIGREGETVFDLTECVELVRREF